MFKHSTYQPAKTEAERLAQENSGYHFFVLRAISCIRRVEVHTEMLAEPPEIMPF